MLTLVRDLWAFMLTEKKLWLMPLVVALLLLGGLLVAAETSAIAPFIYTLF
jgi:hypothetical protein